MMQLASDGRKRRALAFFLFDPLRLGGADFLPRPPMNEAGALWRMWAHLFNCRNSRDLRWSLGPAPEGSWPWLGTTINIAEFDGQWRRPQPLVVSGMPLAVPAAA
jgi:hypothetical protein